MKARRNFTRLVMVAAICLAARVGTAQQTSTDGAAASASAKPAHRVIACYFHRTERCPTCRKISLYVEESLKSGFAVELKDHRVEWKMIDFQDPKNQAYTKAYQIKGPTLVILDINQEKVTTWKVAPEVWSLVGDKGAFLKYVQNEVRSYLEGTRP